MKEKVLVLLGLIACLLLIVAFSRGFVSNDETTSSNENEDDEVTVGETQELRGIAITLNEVTTIEEKEDELIVKVDLTVKNERDTTINLSLMNMTLMDEDYYAYSHASNVETKGILGGQIPAGRVVSGEVAYIVPEGNTFEFMYTDHIQEGQLIFPIELDR